MVKGLDPLSNQWAREMAAISEYIRDTEFGLFTLQEPRYSARFYNPREICRSSSMAEHYFRKVEMWVQFPPSALNKANIFFEDPRYFDKS